MNAKLKTGQRIHTKEELAARSPLKRESPLWTVVSSKKKKNNNIFNMWLHVCIKYYWFNSVNMASMRTFVFMGSAL